MEHWGREPGLGLELSGNLLFPDPEARFLIALKPVGPCPPLEKKEISPHPQFLSLWHTFSFLGWRAEQEGEVWVAAVGRTMTWSGGVGAWMGEREAWAVISPAQPSPTGPRLG